MKVTAETGPKPILQNTTLSGNPVLPVPGSEPDDPVDNAADSVAQVPLTPAGSIALVQSKEADNANSESSVSATFDDPPTPGNRMVAIVTVRSTSTTITGPSGWTERGRVETSSGNNGITVAWSKIVSVGESSTVTVGAANYKRLVVMEFEGVSDFLDVALADLQASANTFPVGDITVTEETLLVGVVQQTTSTDQLTEDADFTNVDKGRMGSQGPAHVVGYRVVSAPDDYDYNPTSATSDTWAGILLAYLGNASDPVFIDAPEVVDGDDATYAESTLADGLHIDLGAPVSIGSIHFIIGHSTSGSKSYDIYGANESDFSDEVLVVNKTFTATGSFTADDETVTVTDHTPYRYWRFEGPIGDRRWFTVEMFSPEAAPISLALDDLTDVDTSGKADGDVLTWDDGSDMWIAVTPTGGSGSVAVDEDGSSVVDPASTIDFRHGLDVSAPGGGVARVAVDEAEFTYGSVTAQTSYGASSGNGSAGTPAHSDHTHGTVSGAVGLSFVIDGGGSVIPTGSKGYIQIPYACTITAARLAADATGAIVVDIKKASYSGLFTLSSITASAKPTLSSARKSEDTTLTGWTTSISAGDWLEFIVDSASTVTRVTLALSLTR